MLHALSNARTTAVTLMVAILLAIATAGCAAPAQTAQPGAPQGGSAVEKNGDIYILYTSDVHCGIDKGFGYVGLKQVRDSLEARGFETILIDDGDSIQGESLGTLSEGEVPLKLMNEVGYDVAIPGNHEFDYGVDRLLELAEMANFPYISCNFTKDGEPVFEPYVILERAGKKIAFVGMTTPHTLTTSVPTYFQDEQGNYIYDFMQDGTGEKLCQSVQKAVDDARAAGADYVFAMAHLGMEADCEPYTYADVIENTRGIDVLFDGHSHDTDQITVKNADGVKVPRTACGTKLANIGYCHITAAGEIAETGIWRWTNDQNARELLGIENSMSAPVDAALADLAKQLDVAIARTDFELTTFDPTEVDLEGDPIQMVRRAETNMGDLCADAIRDQTGADIGLVNAGGVRTRIPKGDITYGDVINIQPFGNNVCAVRATGQQVVDALEWGVRDVPNAAGGFLQVSGISFTIDLTVESSCTADKNGMFTGVAGERRVKDVLVGGEPIDLEKLYLVGGTDYFMLNHGGGNTAFDGAEVVLEEVKADNEALADYLVDTLGGTVSDDYSDPYGQGRITIVQ